MKSGRPFVLLPLSVFTRHGLNQSVPVSAALLVYGPSCTIVNRADGWLTAEHQAGKRRTNVLDDLALDAVRRSTTHSTHFPFGRKGRTSAQRDASIEELWV